MQICICVHVSLHLSACVCIWVCNVCVCVSKYTHMSIYIVYKVTTTCHSLSSTPARPPSPMAHSAQGRRALPEPPALPEGAMPWEVCHATSAFKGPKCCQHAQTVQLGLMTLQPHRSSSCTSRPLLSQGVPAQVPCSPLGALPHSLLLRIWNLPLDLRSASRYWCISDIQ